MKAILSLAVILSSFAARADIIKCYFTEPFLTVTYSMTQSKLTVTDEVMEETKSYKNISFQIMGPAQFELWDVNNKPVMKLDLDYQGSDGMSNNIYPYSAEYLKGKVWANNGFGGCTSNFVNDIVDGSELP